MGNKKTMADLISEKRQAEDEEIVKQLDEHWFKITEATIVDDFCNYTYEITSGVGMGRSHKVDGKKAGFIIDDDMKTAFSKFNVHLAVIDDVFKHSNIEIEDIEREHGHELTSLFHVSGFKFHGGEGNESIQLIGTKYVSGGDRMDKKSPKRMLDKLSSYKWWEDLKRVANKARLEIQLYDGGKYTKEEAEVDDDKEVGTGNLFADANNNDDDDDDFKSSED